MSKPFTGNKTERLTKTTGTSPVLQTEPAVKEGTSAMKKNIAIILSAIVIAAANVQAGPFYGGFGGRTVGPAPRPNFGPAPRPNFGPAPRPNIGPAPRPNFGPAPRPNVGPVPRRF